MFKTLKEILALREQVMVLQSKVKTLENNNRMLVNLRSLSFLQQEEDYVPLKEVVRRILQAENLEIIKIPGSTGYVTVQKIQPPKGKRK